jgi:hypothetical protein
MSSRDFRSGIRGVDGDWRQIWGTQMGAGRIARLKAVPPAARVGVERAVSLDLERCRAAGGVRVMPAKWQHPLRSSARHSLDYHAPV